LPSVWNGFACANQTSHASRITSRPRSVFAICPFFERWEINSNVAHPTNSTTVPQHQSDKKLLGHRGFVACLDFSPDDSNLLASGDSAHVKLWNVEQEGCMFSFKSDSPDRPHFRCSLLNLSFSKDGKHVASAGCDKSI
jgi:WD40 repeat protein